MDPSRAADLGNLHHPLPLPHHHQPPQHQHQQPQPPASLPSAYQQHEHTGSTSSSRRPSSHDMPHGLMPGPVLSQPPPPPGGHEAYHNTALIHHHHHHHQQQQQQQQQQHILLHPHQHQVSQPLGFFADSHAPFLDAAPAVPHFALNQYYHISTDATTTPDPSSFPFNYTSPRSTVSDPIIPTQPLLQEESPEAPRRRRENRYRNAPPGVLSRRRAQNRASQRAYRERKEQRIRDLEQELRESNQRNQSITEAYVTLQAENARLRAARDDGNGAHSPPPPPPPPQLQQHQQQHQHQQREQQPHLNLSLDSGAFEAAHSEGAAEATAEFHLPIDMAGFTHI
ncbi:hypothetical protein HIM_01050 [Hirsutella minnesotensis 3608]|nr:hypothetical protein HIM_01050 [Hirsutella minnesotensis 3608]